MHLLYEISSFVSWNLRLTRFTKARQRRGQFHGLDFDRQRIIGNYIVDFYCKALGLVIEIDGDSHDGREELDETRENWLIAQGCNVVRFPAYLAKDYTGVVLRHLEEYIIAHYS